MRKFENSKKLFQEAQHYLPGGVDSPVRAFKAVGGTPPFIVKGKGSKIYDADGNEFIAYVNSWGPMILGHAYPQVVAALKKAVEQGTSFGAPTELETVLAKMISTAMPSIEMHRDKIIKFDGGYHGHADGLLAKAGSGVATPG